MNLTLKQILARRRATGGIHGVERLRNASDPSFPWTIGDDDAISYLPLHRQILPCKANESRQIVNFLMETDWTKNADGTASLLDGTDGLDVMLRNPGLWAIFGGTDPEYERWIIGDSYFTYGNDEAIEILPFIECPDYCTIDRTTGKSRSIRNETANFAGTGSGATAEALGYPRTSISRYGYESAAALKSAAHEGLSYIDLLYTACMMYIEYRTKNLKLYLGAGASNWGWDQWGTFNGYSPVLKMFEAQLALSGTVSGKMTGSYSKHFEFTYNSAPYIRDTVNPVWRGKSRLWGHLWQWVSRVEMEVQSAGSGGKSYLYVAYPGIPADAKRSDASFAFKDTYKLIGEVPQGEGWVKTIHPNTLAGSLNAGAGETTYACSYNWNTNIPGSGVVRRGLLVGADLHYGGSCAIGSAALLLAPSASNTNNGGGFRANVAG